VTGITLINPIERNSLLPTCLLLLSCFCFGTIPYFAKTLIDSGMASYSVAFYRYGLSAIFLFPLLLRLPPTKWKTAAWGVASGVAVGLGWIGYVEALKTVPVSTVGVLYMTYPVFTLLIGWCWLKDIPSKRSVIAACLVIMAALIASSPAAVETRHLPVLLLSLTAPISFGLGINILIAKLAPLNPLTRVATFCLGASVSLLPLLIISAPGTVLPQVAGGWWLIAGLALGTALIPQTVYSIYAMKVGAARAAVAGSIELPTMFLIGWVMLGETIGLAQWLACALVTFAILLTPARAQKRLSSSLVLPQRPRQ
jgi:drug/metabolite transporter (DMT)-like permease